MRPACNWCPRWRARRKAVSNGLLIPPRTGRSKGGGTRARRIVGNPRYMTCFPDINQMEAECVLSGRVGGRWRGLPCSRPLGSPDARPILRPVLQRQVPPGSSGVTPSASGVTPSATTAPTASSTPAGSAVSAAVRNLTVTGATRSSLTTAFAAFKGIPQSDIAGTRPNSVYYAFDPAADTYWALAEFTATTTAPQDVTVNFQDGGDIGLFTKVGANPWQVRLGGIPPECNELKFYPQVVLAAWSLPTSPTVANMC
jgi:hypothetical protein